VYLANASAGLGNHCRSFVNNVTEPLGFLKSVKFADWLSNYGRPCRMQLVKANH
jgi:hypothetical protein